LIDIMTFVRGLAWHDVGKPFYLGGERHSRLGYLLLDALGYPAEALVTLAHFGRDREVHLAHYSTLEEALPNMPAIITLANAIDRAAAVTYSFMGQKPPDPREKTRHSWQNPFSRLPQRSPVTGGPFEATLHQMDSGEVKRWFTTYLRHWGDGKLSEKAWTVLSNAIEEAASRDDWEPVGRVPSTERDLALQALLGCTALYPERTYPPMNDTTLKQHAHLSGVLAFVLYHNLEAHEAEFLAQTLTLADNVVHLNGRPLSEHDDQERAMAHLNGFLVRISLGGHYDLFANAVRLDDLHGARALARRTLDALVTALAAQLDAPELAGFLPVSRTPFDVVYYLPDSLGKAGIQQTVQRAYDAAVDRVAGELIEELKHDFRAAKPPLDWPSQRNDLKRQLHSLAYGLAVLPVAVGERKDFQAFTAAFAHELVTAYENSLRASLFPCNELRRVRADLELSGGENGSVHDICQVCETHPIYKRFNERMRDEEYLRKAVHEFRGEPEPICVSCIARRILAHSTVRSKPLEKMLHFDGRKTVSARKADDGPSLPSSLARSATFATPDDHLDMGAAFVRQTRSKEKRERGELLDVFPTVSYAADETGNVALLTLEPTEALFDEYDHASIVGWLKGENPDLQELGIAYEARQLREAFEATYINYYRQVEKEEPALRGEVTLVRPHLARALARIDQVNHFYEALQKRLENHPLRVLPIDTVYPTARLMVPADQIDAALTVLDQAIAEDLFSAPPGPLNPAARAFLGHLVPPLLLGSVVVFKEKYPLYLALEAERVLMQRLAEAPANQYWGRPLAKEEGKPKPHDSWFGLRLGLCDLRGTLAERGPWQGQILWQDLGDVVELEGRVDRVTVLHKAILEQEPHMKPLADALALIRVNVVSGTDLADAKRLNRDPALFRPVLFLKQLTREGAR
jgi:hypothetical protein